ncbi:MAG: N-6 DNA methylase, partial [Leptospira sp.]|nr:N-6 DNA methylase [Leptospira sp.]
MAKLTDKSFTRYMRSNLFSVDFLENHLEDLEDFKSLDDNVLKEKFKEASSFYKDNLNILSEAQLETDFLQPIFRSLGHIYEVQTAKKSEDSDEGTKRIDYAFFYTEEDKDLFRGNLDEKNAIKFAHSSTICEAKSWGLLDGYDKVKKNDNSDPIWQIKKSYLDNINAKEQKAKVPFGILTDGKSWRIYSYRAEIDKFFELNLEEIIKNRDFDRFKIFWFFFSKEAFRGKSYLSSVESGSKKLQSQVSDDLRKQVYLSLELIATGLFRVYNAGRREWDEFKKYPEMIAHLKEKNLDEIDISNPATEKIVLDIIYVESLVYLFRVLFLLYADHRNLFSHRKVESVFYQLLEKIESYNQIGSIPEGANNISDKNDDYDINGVFEEIDIEFNGGLFSTKLHTILNRFDIDNILYANAIDYLTRTFDTKTQKPQRVDFSVLEVRHLGTIYEGLLEYKLSKADKDTTIPLLIDKKKTRKVLKGDLFLVNEKGERKASGSYYTPDYIVECIVKNTVGPLIDAIERENISLKEKIQRILALRILDPAMGSGHFLVEVINYINSRIEALIQTEWEEYANKPGRKSKTQTELEALLKDAEEGYYKRIIAKKCIYGVDKNPMAVELAKLSIWIYTLQKKRKLEFFDYNLRCGDSLIGSQEKTFSSQLDSKSKERMLFADNDELYKNVVEDFKEEFKKYFELESVEERMKYYETTIKPNQQKLKYLANIELAIAFADKNDEIHSIYNAHKNKLLGIIRMDKKNQYIAKLTKGINLEDWEIKLFQAAKAVRDQYNPIHWELDFPNVFIEGGGFDGIVGNPPYVQSRSSLLNEEEKKYYNFNFKTAQYQLNTYTIFVERSLSLFNRNAFLGFIIPNYWLSTKFDEHFRDLVFHTYHTKELINTYGVFEAATVDTILVFIGANSSYPKSMLIRSLDRSISSIDERMKLLEQNIWKFEKELIIENRKQSIDIVFENSLKLKGKRTLSEFFIFKKGMQPYEQGKGNPKQTREMMDNKVYDSNYKIDTSYLPLLRARDIRRYQLLWDTNFIKYGDNLAAPRSIDIFKGPRILVRRIINGNYLDGIYIEEEYINNTDIINILPKENLKLNIKIFLPIFNSRLYAVYLKRSNVNLDRDAFPKINVNTMEQIPVPDISKSNEKELLMLADTILTKNKELQEVQNKFTKLLQSDLKIEKLTEKLKDWFRLTWDEFLAELKKKKVELKLDQKAEWMDFFEKEKAKALAIQDTIDKTD